VWRRVNESSTNYQKHAQNLDNYNRERALKHVEMIAKGFAGPHMREISEALQSQALNSSSVKNRGHLPKEQCNLRPKNRAMEGLVLTTT
jgi:ribosomal protein S11